MMNDRGGCQRRPDLSLDEGPTNKRIKAQPLVPSSADTTATVHVEATMKYQQISSTTFSADDVLVQMVQSGNYSQDQVVEFCRSSGIPLSRMLRLDLMRLGSQKNYASHGHSG